MTEVVKRKTGGRWRVGAFSLPIIGMLWFIASIVLFVSETALQGVGSLLALSPAINLVVIILFIMSIPLTVISIIMIARKNTLLLGESIRFGWGWTKKTIWFWVGVLLLGGLGSFLLGVWGGMYTTPNPFDAISGDSIAQNVLTSFVSQEVVAPGKELEYNIYTVIAQLLKMIFMICITGATISIVYTQSLKLRNFIDQVTLKKVLYYVLGWILYVVCITLGMILLIVPGIIIAIRWKFFDLGILKEGMGPIASLKNSWKITKGNFREVISLTIMQGLIQLPGALALGIGLFWTIPTARIADVKAYEILVKRKEVTDLEEGEKDDSIE